MTACSTRLLVGRVFCLSSWRARSRTAGIAAPLNAELSEASSRMPLATRAAWKENVPVRFQLVIDCADPDRLTRFWAAALDYEPAPPPAGFATWNDFYRDLGLPDEYLVDGADRISDPDGHGPVIWFRVEPDAKTVKNRLHLDIHASGERTDPLETRAKRFDAEASRLAGLGATISGAVSAEGLDHYAVGMKDPEGNEFDIN
jgi:Glyoxalase-like domain